jgi:hypothetical protein
MSNAISCERNHRFETEAAIPDLENKPLANGTVTIYPDQHRGIFWPDQALAPEALPAYVTKLSTKYAVYKLARFSSRPGHGRARNHYDFRIL